jgi:ASC-1-like (ASCH) protein
MSKQHTIYTADASTYNSFAWESRRYGIVLATPQWCAANIGDKLDVIDSTKEQPNLLFRIVSISGYLSVESLLTALKPEVVMPEIKTVKEGVDKWRAIYSEADEKKYGVRAFELAKI